MRPSALPSRSAQSSSGNAKLREKKRELEAVAALERASGLVAERIAELCLDGEIMADAGLVHGQVLSQWGDMFDILDLFLSTREQRRSGEEDESHSTAQGVQLVRIPVEDLQATSSDHKDGQ